MNTNLIMAEAAGPGEPLPAKTPLLSRRREAAAPVGLRVLCVEDDEQTLAVLRVLFETEGYEVATAVTADQGMALLRAQKFHLVVSDYWLPDRTGASLVRSAGEDGLLGGAAVLIVTAEHRPQGVENLTVLNKPLDLDELLAAVNEKMAPARESELVRARQDLERKVALPGDAKVELTLYVSASSPSSLKAVKNLERILASYEAGAVRFSLCDLSKDPDHLADEDHIAFTPTLVKRTPDPKVWILGDLERTEVVHDLLAMSGLQRAR